jgi:hypothetical protein
MLESSTVAQALVMLTRNLYMDVKALTRCASPRHIDYAFVTGQPSHQVGHTAYKLIVPLPVPTKLVWSETVFQALSRTDMQTTHGRATLRSLIELKDAAASRATLPSWPDVPNDAHRHWIRTVPGRGWFSYFRVANAES